MSAMIKLEDMTINEALLIAHVGWHGDDEYVVYNHAKEIIARHGRAALSGYVKDLPCPKCGLTADK